MISGCWKSFKAVQRLQKRKGSIIRKRNRTIEISVKIGREKWWIQFERFAWVCSMCWFFLSLFISLFDVHFTEEPDAFRALTQAWVMAFLTQIAATLIFLTYGTTIAANSGTTISKETATITVGISQMCGTTISSVFIDTKGRKFLLILSLAGCAVSLTGLAVHLYLRSYGFDLSFVHWVPLLCMTLNVLFASLGIIPLRLVCLIESMPIKVRSAGVTIGNFAVNLFSFLIVKVYPLLSVIIQPEGCFAIFGIFCALGIIYVILYVKETKGIDLNVVNDGKPEIEKVATVSVITRL